MPVFTIELPDGRTMDAEAPDQATALQGAQQWHAANPIGTSEDLAKTAPTAAVHLATSTLGMPGDIGAAVSAAGDKLGIPQGVKSAIGTVAGGLPVVGAMAKGPTSQDLNTLAEKATGSLYQPQTMGGKLLDTGAQFLPAVFGGPEGLIAKLATRVAAPAAGLEAAKAVTDNPYIQTGAAIASSALAHKAVTPGAAKAAVPTIDQTKAASSAGYASPEIAAVQFKPQAIENLSDSIANDLKRAKANEKLAPQTFTAVEDLKTPVNAGQDIENLETTRKLLGNIAGNFNNPVEQRAATIAIKKLDTYLAGNIPQSHLIAGDAAAANKALTTARADYASAMTAEKVAEKLRNAELQAASAHSGGNIDNATRQKLRPLLTSAKQGRGLTDTELQQIEDSVRGSAAGNALRATGKILGGGGGLGMLHAATVGGLAAGPLGVLTPALGFGVKKAGDMLTRRSADAIVQQILSRSPEAQKWAAIQARINAANPQPRLGSLRGGLLSGAFAQPSRGLLALDPTMQQ